MPGRARSAGGTLDVRCAAGGAVPSPGKRRFGRLNAGAVIGCLFAWRGMISARPPSEPGKFADEVGEKRPIGPPKPGRAPSPVGHGMGPSRIARTSEELRLVPER